jgi:hypothetical protein
MQSKIFTHLLEPLQKSQRCRVVGQKGGGHARRERACRHLPCGVSKQAGRQAGRQVVMFEGGCDCGAQASCTAAGSGCKSTPSAKIGNTGRPLPGMALLMAASTSGMSEAPRKSKACSPDAGAMTAASSSPMSRCTPSATAASTYGGRAQHFMARVSAGQRRQSGHAVRHGRQHLQSRMHTYYGAGTKCPVGSRA